ncbi:hypothetical protein [Streptomyces nigrescens]|uniref:hypothetical protein n=1 Tax=Streptomyces nigrescens TaxID=1920 RepID=UPI00367FB550
MAWLPEAPARRRLVFLRRLPPELLPLCDEDGRLVRPYLPASTRHPVDQDARRRELEEAVRRLNSWSSGGGGRR